MVVCVSVITRYTLFVLVIYFIIAVSQVSLSVGSIRGQGSGAYAAGMAVCRGLNQLHAYN